MIRLKFERINRRISQQTLAFVTKLPQPIISLIETGTWNPSPDQLSALGRALHIAPPELLLQEVVMPADSRSRFVEARTGERREAQR